MKGKIRIIISYTSFKQEFEKYRLGKPGDRQLYDNQSFNDKSMNETANF